jgi:hypothetical protein
MSLLLPFRFPLLGANWCRNLLWKNARAIPSLDLDFAGNKSLKDGISNQDLITFTRASSATYAGADGTVKTAVTNLLLRSEEFDNASWPRSGATVPTITANVGIAPDGNTTADLLTRSITGSNFISQAITKTASTIQYTFSIFVKQSVGNFCALRCQGTYPNKVDVVFNISSGIISTAATVAGGTFTGPSASITPYLNSWYRLTVTVTSDTNTGYQCIASFNSNGSVVDGTDSVSNSAGLLWGAQLEQSSTVGDYIQTTSAINSAPRFDHNPTTGESLGLLVEEARTNLVTASADFSTGWTPTRAALTTNQTTAPDGTTTADLLTEDTSTNTHIIQSSFAVTSGTSYTLSVWVKQNTSVSPTRNIRLFLPSGQFGSGSAVAAGFDLATGVITVTNSPSATSLQFYANGWVRVSVTSTCTTTGTASISLQMTSGVTTSYTGGSSGLYLWGAQFEAGAFMTSYIPTTGTTATRAADVASITGAAFSSFYNQTEGTVHAAWQFNAGAISTARIICNFNDNSVDQFIGVFASGSNTLSTNSFVAGTSQGRLDIGSPAALLPYKSATAYGAGNRAFTLNGVPPVSGTGSLPSATRLEIGYSFNSNFVNGTIRRLTYWPTRLSDTALQSITAP